MTELLEALERLMQLEKLMYDKEETLTHEWAEDFEFARSVIAKEKGKMSAFWTMTDFDGAGYVNNSKGDTIIKTVDYDSAVELANYLNRNPAITIHYQPELKAVAKRIPTKKG